MSSACLPCPTNRQSAGRRQIDWLLSSKVSEARSRMPIDKRCDNCVFSTYATGPGRATLICRQKAGAEGRWKTVNPLYHCTNFHPSRAADPKNPAPRAIPLTKGLFAVVDAEDYRRLARCQWFAENGQKTYYAVRKQNGKSIKMHREILNTPEHLFVDHIDHNGLNNQKKNLRLATFSQNCQNRRHSKLKTSTSKYKGVHWHKDQKKWAAQITANKKSHHLGYFSSETTAAHTYDLAAKKYHGRFASLNFPQKP